jgi:hypothetical protein
MILQHSGASRYADKQTGPNWLSSISRIYSLPKMAKTKISDQINIEIAAENKCYKAAL